MGWRALNKFDSDALRWCYVMKKLLKDLYRCSRHFSSVQ